MNTKNLKISPEKFAKIKAQYQDAIRAREEDISYLILDLGWTQQKTADLYQIDIAAINRIVNRAKEREAA